jgi:predicted lipoprotein with Yx(FWY)xxD motif
MRTRRGLRLAVALGGAIVVGVVAGLVLTGSRGGDSASRPAAPAGEVSVSATRLGRILVDGRSRTLYLYTPDHHGKSVCYGSCARIWPPALVSARPRAGSGVTASALGTTERRDHRLQLVYHGHPLYRVVTDKRSGQMTGQGYDGVWFAVAPSGRRVLAGAEQTAPGGY